MSDQHATPDRAANEECSVCHLTQPCKCTVDWNQPDPDRAAIEEQIAKNGDLIARSAAYRATLRYRVLRFLGWTW